MYRGIRRPNIPQAKLVPLEAVEEIVRGITNPVKKVKPIEADGGAFRSYCYNVYTKKGKN